MPSYCTLHILSTVFQSNYEDSGSSCASMPFQLSEDNRTLNCLLKAMLASESYLACLSMNHLFFKLIIKMQVFEHFLITGFISYAYCCHGNLHQQPKYITLRGNKYLRQIFSFRFLFFHPDIKIHLVSILSEGIFDKMFFLREK